MLHSLTTNKMFGCKKEDKCIFGRSVLDIFSLILQANLPVCGISAARSAIYQLIIYDTRMPYLKWTRLRNKLKKKQFDGDIVLRVKR